MDVYEAIEPLISATNGDFRKLAKHIEDGGEINYAIRNWLVKYLRGELSFPRKGSWDQHRTESKWLHEINMERLSSLHSEEKMITEYRAIKNILDRNPKVNAETLKGYVKKRDKTKR